MLLPPRFTGFVALLLSSSFLTGVAQAEPATTTSAAEAPSAQSAASPAAGGGVTAPAEATVSPPPGAGATAPASAATSAPVGIETTGMPSSSAIPTADEALGTVDTASPSSARGELSRKPVVILPERDTVRLPPPKTRYWMMGLGLGATGLWYVGALGIGELWSGAPGNRDLRIPVAGPFMDLAKTGCPSSDSDCSAFQLVVRTFMVSIDALGQAGSLAIAIEGAFTPTESSSGESVVPPPKMARSRSTVVPTAWFDPQTGGGVGVAGQF